MKQFVSLCKIQFRDSEKNFESPLYQVDSLKKWKAKVFCFPPKYTMRKKRSKWKYAALTKTINCPRREYWIANSRGNFKLIANWLCGNGFLVLCLFKPNGCGLFYIYERKCERFKQNKILFINCFLWTIYMFFVVLKYFIKVGR